MRWLPFLVLVALVIVAIIIAQQSLKTYQQLSAPVPIVQIANTTNKPKAAEAPSSKPKVEQTSYHCEVNPDDGMLRATVVLKNIGRSKAFNVQTRVRPFKGTTAGLNDNGVPIGPRVTDSDPVAQMGEWVSFPDLDPGQMATQTVEFVEQPGIPPGDNLEPEITFDAGQAAAPAAAH